MAKKPENVIKLKLSKESLELIRQCREDLRLIRHYLAASPKGLAAFYRVLKLFSESFEEMLEFEA